MPGSPLDAGCYDTFKCTMRVGTANEKLYGIGIYKARFMGLWFMTSTSLDSIMIVFRPTFKIVFDVQPGQVVQNGFFSVHQYK